MKWRALACALLAPSAAWAQLHWDAGVHGGAQERVLVGAGGAPPGAALPGPTFGAQGHVALLPFVRIGLYGSFDASSVSGTSAPARMFYAAGGQAKLLSPWPRGALRVFLTAGFGYVAAYAPSYRTTVRPVGQPPSAVAVDGSGGGFAEIPVGVGVSYRLRGPLALYAELLTRFGAGFWGTLYGEGGGRNGWSDAVGPVAIAPDGYDIVSFGLVVGLALDR